jgi:hypothetical protein
MSLNRAHCVSRQFLQHNQAGSFAALSCAQELESRVLELGKAGYADREIAERLSLEGLRSPGHECVPESTVRRLRLKHRMMVDRHHPHRLRPTGHLAIRELAQRLSLPEHWIYYQIRSGRIEIARDPATGLYLFPDRPETVAQLQRLSEGKIDIVRL